MEVPYTWRPTGWFQIGWSRDVLARETIPLRYFGEDLQERIDKEFLSTMEDDLEIWRYQRYIEHPALAQQDAKPYKALREWARQFYDE